MINIFLSYCRKDMDKFKNILKNLESLNNYCILRYYQPTSENNFTMINFIDSLSEADIFVVFLSDNSLDSKYVQEEILKAIELSKLGNIREICPIIIDINITADSDNRIPGFIKNSIYHATSPIKAAELIKENTKKLMY